MMKSVPRKALLVGSAAAGVLALGIAVPAVALAQDPTPSPSATSSSSRDEQRGTASASPSTSDRDERRAQRRDDLAEALATELGISKEKVAAALDKVLGQMNEQARAERLTHLKERLATAVREDKLTQAQADAILKAAEEGVLPGGHGGPGGRPGHGPR
jgi:hypothetical protein